MARVMRPAKGAYYNEINPDCAWWLRDLMKRGLIADGEVDQRSIRDVCPADLRGFVQCHFFAGVGLWSYALRLAGIPDTRRLWTGSCPCQPFSQAGKGDGFDDERHLWPDFHWLIDQCRPELVLGEQVASEDGLMWLDLVFADLDRSGYARRALDFPAAGVGAPNIRQRLWWVGERDAARRVADASGARRQQDAGETPRDEAPDGRSGWIGRQPDGDHVAASDGADGVRRLGDAAAARREHSQDAGADRGCEGASDTAHDGRRAGLRQSERASPDGERGLGDAKSRGRGEHGLLDEAAGGGEDPGQPAFPDQDAPGGLGDPGSDGHEGQQRAVVPEIQGRPSNAGGAGAGSMADPERAGLPDAGAQELPGAGRGRQGREPQPPRGPRHPWRELEWIACTDGKRRPTRAPFFRLVDGNPGQLAPERPAAGETPEGWERVEIFPLAKRRKGDVARLRAYGNAINPVVAAEIIRAYMETKGES